MALKKTTLPGLSRRPLVAASLGDFHKLLHDARAAARDGASVLEVRADLFPRETLRPDPLRRALAELRRAVRLPIILTLRCRAERGGLPRGLSEQDRLALFRAAYSHVDAVDVELGADRINQHVASEAHKRGRTVMLSFHDFRGTPPGRTLAALARKAKRLGGDVLKVAAAARRAEDAEALMDFCRRTEFGHRVCLAMGPLGRESRLHGFRWGSCLTYGYVRKPLAPGQLAVKDLAAAQKAG